MAITKQMVVDQITVTENGIVLYREATRIIEDGALLTQTYHRTSLTPGQDLTGQPANVVAIAEAARRKAGSGCCQNRRHRASRRTPATSVTASGNGCITSSAAACNWRGACWAGANSTSVQWRITPVIASTPSVQAVPSKEAR